MTMIPQSEVLRYLGTQSADAPLMEQIQEICAYMEQHITPRGIWREYPCTVTEDAAVCSDTVLPGKDLAAHLKGCTAFLLLATTLGTEADRLARTEGARASVRAAIVHAAGAAMIEQYCDDLQSQLAKEYEAKGLYLRPRYSPGYGDLPLSCQRDFFQLLELPKRLGLSLNEHNMMTPSKSVTAVIGISPEAKKSFRKCFSCGKKDCPFRKKDTDTQ